MTLSHSHKRFILINFALLFAVQLLIPPSVQGQSCSNGNFETGTLTNWSGTYSEVDDWTQNDNNHEIGTVTNFTGFDPNFNSDENVQVVTNNTMVDPYVPGLSTVYPGGGDHSLRLGNYYNHIGNNPQNAEGTITLQLTVPSDNFVFTFHYAVVLEDPNDNHETINENGEEHLYRPYFSVKMLDQSQNNIDCADYFALADPDQLDDYTYIKVDDDPDDGNINTPCQGGGCSDIYYRDWTTISVPLGDYVGQTLSVTFTASDCKLGGHLGYAYLEVDCNEPFIEDITFCPETGIEITAPDGFFSYEWVGTDVTGLQTQTVTVNEAGNYQVTLTPITTAPCPKTFDINVIEDCVINYDTISFCESTLNSQSATNILMSDYTPRLETTWNMTISDWYTDDTRTEIIDPNTPIDLSDQDAVYISFVDGNGKSGALYISFKTLPLPTVFAGMDTTICSGGNAQLNATLSTEYTYEWSPSTTLSNNTINNPIATPVDNQTEYIVAVTNENNCINRDTVKVLLLPNPVPSVTITYDKDICLGEAIVFSVETRSELGDNPQYAWTRVDNSENEQVISTNPNSVSITDFTMGESVFLSITTSEQCVLPENAIAVSNVVSPKVYLYPEPFISGDTTLCSGENLSLLATDSAELTTSFTWTHLESGNTTLAVSQLDIENITEDQTYTVTATNWNCTSTSPPHHISPITGPDEFSLTIDYDRDICVGDRILFNLESSQNIGEDPQYTWTKIDTSGIEQLISSNPDTVSSSSFIQGESIYLTVSSTILCVAPENSIAISNILFPQVYQYPAPHINGLTSICAGESVTLSASDTKDLTTNFEWTHLQSGDTIASGSELEIKNITQDQSYTVTATNWNCTSTSPPHHIAPISPFIDLEADKYEILLGDQTHLFVTTNVDSFVWDTSPDIDDLIADNTSFSTQSPIEHTFYMVSGELNGCPVSDKIEIKVYPPISAPYLFSPNDDNNNDIWIVENLSEYHNAKVYIYNRWGTLIQKLEDGDNTWDGRNIAGEHLPDGVYYYVVMTSIIEEEVSITGYVTIAK